MELAVVEKRLVVVALVVVESPTMIPRAEFGSMKLGSVDVAHFEFPVPEPPVGQSVRQSPSIHRVEKLARVEKRLVEVA